MSKKIISLLLVLVMLVACFASCGLFKKKDDKKETPKTEYTYKGYSTALGTNWNPHTWETNADQSLLSYISMPFASIEAKDTENGIYQWVFEMAESIKDVTAANQSDLTKYNVSLPTDEDGNPVAANTVTEGYVYEFKLNKNAKWQNGEAITADTYVESMKRLLSSKYRNYRANLYVAGESAIAGGLGYYNSEAPIYAPIVPAYEDEPDYSFDVDKAIAEGNLYINVTSTDMTLYPESLVNLNNDYLGSASVAETFDALKEAANPYGYTLITAENKELVYKALADLFVIFGVNDAETAAVLAKETFFYNTGKFGDKVEWETVGLYKVDDYTMRYVCQTAIDFNYFLTSCTDTWLVYVPLYDQLSKEEGGLLVTTYCTSVDTSMSYGIYKLDTYEDNKQVVYTQNENWYGWTKDADGNLVSYTDCIKALDMETGALVPFLVDGKVRQQYQTTKVVIDVMTEEVAKQKFLKGELSGWSPPSDELSQYALSERLYKVDETYTMSFFFNTGVAALKKLDAAETNKNSVVLSNDNFRKAFSLAVDRADFVSVTQGWTPAYSLMNHLYHYDIFNDPNSSYRSSDEAMQAICNLYGVEYGSDKLYKTLKEAYESITGYNLTQAQALMKTACEELVAADLYTAGEEIKIQIGWAKGAIQADDSAQLDKINEYLNKAIAGSGFGKITFEAIGNINDRYADTAKGIYAIGYGAWGGAAFYPFRNFQVYMDPSQYDINEAGCWDPTVETLTLTVDGEEYTMTWQAWSNSMIGTGVFAAESFETKLQITAQLEQLFLEKYYRIPLAVTTSCSLLSYQMDYYTQNYNIMYGFGGDRLLSYNYTDAEWAAYLAEQNGTLNYK